MRFARAISNPLKSAIVFALLLQCVWILGLTVNEGWHHQIHEDADHEDHQCAVVELGHGAWLNATTTVVAIPQPPLPSPMRFIGVSAREVSALFLDWELLEHAPPTLG